MISPVDNPRLIWGAVQAKQVREAGLQKPFARLSLSEGFEKEFCHG
jgi:hypothetical protein